MPNPISTFASFVGFGKESTPGTAAAPTLFMPVKEFKPEDVRNYVADDNIRGSYVDSYNEVPTQGWSTYECQGNVYLDTFPILLKSLLGDETLSGTASPYTHAISTLNSGQPPTYTVTDYNGFNARQFPYSLCTSIEVKYDATGLLEHTTQLQGFPSATTTKPTQTFSSVAAKAAYTGVASIGGTSTLLISAGSLKLDRKTNPLIAITGTQNPVAIWGGAVGVTGQFTFIYEDDTFLTPMLNGTQQSIDLTFGASPLSLELHGSSALFTKATVERSKDWVELQVDFTCVANTSDAGASGGYSPMKATVVNSQSSAY